MNYAIYRYAFDCRLLLIDVITNAFHVHPAINCRHRAVTQMTSHVLPLIEITHKEGGITHRSKQKYDGLIYLQLRHF